jgi:hypothetical protein
MTPTDGTRQKNNKPLGVYMTQEAFMASIEWIIERVAERMLQNLLEKRRNREEYPWVEDPLRPSFGAGEQRWLRSEAKSIMHSLMKGQ